LETIFPGHLLFEAVPEAQLEIHTSKVISAVLADKITCALKVNEGSAFPHTLIKGKAETKCHIAANRTIIGFPVVLFL